MRRLSYDERQIEPPLRICAKCGRSFYMRADMCAQCGPGFRTKQTPAPDVRDVNGTVMFDP